MLLGLSKRRGCSETDRFHLRTILKHNRNGEEKILQVIEPGCPVDLFKEASHIDEKEEVHHRKGEKFA